MRPFAMAGPLRRPGQGYGVIAEFATEADANSFIAWVGSDGKEAHAPGDHLRLIWHDLLGEFANEALPPATPIIVEQVATSSDGWIRIDYREVQ